MVDINWLIKDSEYEVFPELEMVKENNVLKAKSIYSVFVCDIGDDRKQKDIIEHEAFLKECAVTFVPCKTCLMALFELPGDLNNHEINELIKELALECYKKMKAAGTLSGMDFGIGGAGMADDISKLAGQAVKAKTVNSHMKDVRTVTFEEQLIYHFLMESCDDKIKELGSPIAERLDEELINTLEELVFSGWKYKETAEKLFVHRNTLLFRKNKIFEALNSGENAGQVTFMEIQVYAYRILKYIKGID